MSPAQIENLVTVGITAVFIFAMHLIGHGGVGWWGLLFLFNLNTSRANV